MVWEDRLLSDREIYPFYLLQDGKTAASCWHGACVSWPTWQGCLCLWQIFVHVTPFTPLPSHRPLQTSHLELQRHISQTVIQQNGSVFSALACKIMEAIPVLFPGELLSSPEILGALCTFAAFALLFITLMVVGVAGWTDAGIICTAVEQRMLQNINYKLFAQK